jgi:hypothetical protein
MGFEGASGFHPPVTGGGGGGTIGGGGTLNYVAMFTPDGSNIGDAPIKIGDTFTRLFPVNTGQDSIAIGYDINLNGIDNFLIGYDLNDNGGQEVYALGNRLNIIDNPIIYGAVVLGFFNTIQGNGNTQGLYLIGDSNVIEDNLFSTIIGEQNTIERNTSSTILGLSNNISDSNDINTFGNTNTINSCISILNIGSGNGLSSLTNSIVIGRNNVLAISNEIYIAQNDIGIRVDVNGNTSVGVPTADTIDARFHVRGVDSVNTVNQRLEPVNAVYEDTTGNTINTTDDTVTTLETIEIPNNSIILINSNITCRKTGGAGVGVVGQGNGYIRTVVAQNIAGVVSIGIIQSSFTSENIINFDTTFTISGTNVLLQVTGAINDDVKWNSITKKYNV